MKTKIKMNGKVDQKCVQIESKNKQSAGPKEQIEFEGEKSAIGSVKWFRPLAGTKAKNDQPKRKKRTSIHDGSRGVKV